MSATPLRRCPDCGAQVLKLTDEAGDDGKRGLFLKGRSFRLFGDKLLYTCPKCPHEFTIALGKHKLSPLFFQIDRARAS